ncbi:hypothetical protein FQN50_000510 [Emmonsiellopsis sp. PD_5]|nr:hypothetical protein FQN50_000510 [Emmonsiellopsis sp. PD_5]
MENITFIYNLIVDLHLKARIKTKDILILVLYHDQYLAYITALNQLQLMNSVYDHITVYKIDSFQGCEHSITIVDLVIARSLGFRQEQNCLNVAFSHAINACYVIYNLNAFNNMQNHHGAHSFVKMVSHFKQFHAVHTKKEESTCNYIGIRKATRCPTANTGYNLVATEDGEYDANDATNYITKQLPTYYEPSNAANNQESAWPDHDMDAAKPIPDQPMLDVNPPPTASNEGADWNGNTHEPVSTTYDSTTPTHN